MYIAESDFDSGLKPRDSFFDKINALVPVLSGTPATPQKPPLDSTKTTVTSAPSENSSSKEVLAGKIFTLGATLIEQSRAQVAGLDNGVKAVVEPIMNNVSTALVSKDVIKLKQSLVPIQVQESFLSSEQKQSLHELLALIHQWEEAKPVDPTPPKTAPIVVHTIQKTEVKDPAKDAPKEPDWKDKAK
jgi:hypothetical protein